MVPVLRGEVAIRLPGESESVREALKSASGGDFAGGRERYEATLKKWLAQASLELGTRISQKIKVYALPPDELIASLGHPEVDRRMDAAERLAMLRHVPAVEALAKRLNEDSDRNVRFRIVGHWPKSVIPRDADRAADPRP